MTALDTTPTEMNARNVLPARSARQVLDWSRDLVDPAVRGAVARLPASMRRVAAYHFGWSDAHGVPATASRGKAIRPALVLLSAQAVGGTPESAVAAAAAVELVHNFSLIHDDVMDGDLSRRHRPTVWRVFGVRDAILAGDGLLTLAFAVLATGRSPAGQDGTPMLIAAMLDLLDGQSADLAFEDRTDVSLSECINMIEAKTGALLASACALGALSAGGSPAQVEHLRNFGTHLGVAFQLVDDILGIWGDPAVTGKPARSDLTNRKKSVPVLAALTSGTPAGEQLAEFYERDQPPSRAELRQAADLIEAAGGRSSTQIHIDDHLARAFSELRAAGPTPQAAAELRALGGFVVHRNW